MNLYQKAIDYAVIDILGKITWQKTFAKFNDGREYLLTKAEQEKIAKILDINSCIILTRRNSHLSTYGTSLAHFLKTGRWGYYSHALVNIERDDEPYRMMEATGIGTHWTGFNDVFNCDSACLLKPRGITLEDWKEIFDNAPTLLGIPYDSLFDFSDPTRLSCIELVYNLLQKAAPHIPATLALAYMLKKYGCLTPQMVRDTNAFEILLEIRH